MKAKRLLACLAAGAMMLSFAACSQGGDSESQSSSDAGTSSSSTAGDASGIVKTGGSTSVEKVMGPAMVSRALLMGSMKSVIPAVI